jgi:hypothetical protein
MDILVATAYYPRTIILGMTPGVVNSNDAPGIEESAFPR